MHLVMVKFSFLIFPFLFYICITQCLMAHHSHQMYSTYALTPGRFGLPMPIYVNMVRDPVERVISWYYYVRAPWYFVERKRAFPDLPLPNPNWLRKVNVVKMASHSFLSVKNLYFIPKKYI